MIILFVLCGGCISIPTQAKETVIIMNEYLSVEVSPLGAELQSLKSKQSGIEYLWQGNPEYWKRRSPILFPFIGRLWKNGYNYNNERYEIEMHGFAKDCIFDVVKKEETEIWFRLSDSEITLKKYPFKFELLIGYILEGKEIEVVWNVKNKSDRIMPFQIGGHPGFKYPDFSDSDVHHAYLKFESGYDAMSYIMKAKNGFFLNNSEKKLLVLNNEGLLPVNQALFKDDALVFENYQARKVTILDKNKVPFISVSFDMPVFALWSLSDKDAPFLCIEPWWGIGDKDQYAGNVEGKKWIQYLSPFKDFVTSYCIEFL